MNKEEINKLAEDTINSIDTISRASAGASFYNKVLDRISEKERTKKSKKFISGYGWKLVAVFIVLALINLFTLFNYSGQQANTYEQNIYSFIQEYSLSNSTYNY